MLKTTTRVLLGFILCATLGACAGSSDEPEQTESESNSTPADVQSDDENVAKTQQEMRWTKPMCAYYVWRCGQCICNACGVEDCRAVVVN